MAEIKRITIVTAQGVSDYTVGSKHKPENEKPVAKIERTYGYTDFCGKYVGGHYSVLSESGNLIATITESCPIVVDYF
ncbi:hypothetical protein [Bacteroides timonensis]|uniref:hypothetical protein n=1 Tax=Bacteroides timonensis TaxID=1470345 RepID=UPI0004B061A1|nr:hypothetical protein [Bacteroides timonensis]